MADPAEVTPGAAGTTPAEARHHELSHKLAAVRERMAQACRQAGRRNGDVHLVTVTKFFPAADVERLVRLGVGDIGESRDQEASAKMVELGERLALDGRSLPRVHFVGQVQTNKARSVVRYADVVHSVDRTRLVRSLDRATAAALDAGERTAYLKVLVQLDLEEGEHAGRGGVLPDGALALAAEVAECAHLSLRGVMAVAPPGLEPDGLRRAFDRVRACAQLVRADHPDATWVSAGMSGDLEQAVAAGATHLRVGSAILGHRPDPR